MINFTALCVRMFYPSMIAIVVRAYYEVSLMPRLVPGWLVAALRRCARGRPLGGASRSRASAAQLRSPRPFSIALQLVVLHCRTVALAAEADARQVLTKSSPPRATEPGRSKASSRPPTRGQVFARLAQYQLPTAHSRALRK